jgi:hypothetical protein|tara:strand:+ start:1749 stop:2111 length:363 start_codon:yes stop_codon:yes gene_type:complete
MIRSNQSNLIADAISAKDFWSSASDGKWLAECTGYGIDVYHYETHMFTFLNDGSIVPVDPGHGSTSDRCGVRKITSGPGRQYGIGYTELYKTDKAGNLKPLPALLRSPGGFVMGINYKAA